MSEQAQVGDTVRLTIEGKVYAGIGGHPTLAGWWLDLPNRTYKILSRAVPLLPNEPGTWWLDKYDNFWRVNYSGKLICDESPENPNSNAYAPFRQLVLK